MPDHRIDYCICTTPRTGSSMLCGLLLSTGVLGAPAEHFNDVFRPKLRVRFGVDPSLGDAGYWREVRHKGQTGNVMGLKSMPWPWERVAGIVRPTHLIYLTRADELAQAISWYRAGQTGCWYGGSPACEFNEQAILARLMEIRQDNRYWERAFEEYGRSPLRMTYDELVFDPDAAVRRIAGFLGVTLPAGWRGEPRSTVQRDELSRQWYEMLAGAMEGAAA